MPQTLVVAAVGATCNAELAKTYLHVGQEVVGSSSYAYVVASLASHDPEV